MTNTIQLGPFLGVNNRLPDFALIKKDVGAFVRQAVNVDVDNAGRIRRRVGRELIQAMTSPHSYFDNGSMKFMVRGSVLYSVNLSPYSETYLASLSNNNAVSYEVWGSDTYLTNGADRLRVSASGGVYPWAMATPEQPYVATVSGTLSPGWYQVAVTFSNSVTGEESGCAGSTNYELAATGALRVTIPAAVPGADKVNIYCSMINGSVPLRQATVNPGGTYDITIVSTTGRQCGTLYEEPIPAGTQVVEYNGRMLVVSGDYVYYSPPFRPGYHKPSEGYVPFPGAVSIVAPAQNGLYVVADKTRWFPGDINAPIDTIRDVLPYGGVPGTYFKFPHNSNVGWFGNNGFVFADTQGQVNPVMSDDIDLVPPDSGTVAVLDEGGFRRAVACGWCINLETTAASTYTSYAFTSASAGVGTFSDGVYWLTGNLDGTAQIDASVELGKHNFGADNLKHVPAAYLGVQSDDFMEFRVTAPDDVDYTYDAIAYDDELRVQRIDLGKGLRANWFDFWVYNTAGCNFTLASVSVAPKVSQRRIG